MSHLRNFKSEAINKFFKCFCKKWWHFGVYQIWLINHYAQRRLVQRWRRLLPPCILEARVTLKRKKVEINRYKVLLVLPLTSWNHFLSLCWDNPLLIFWLKYFRAAELASEEKGDFWSCGAWGHRKRALAFLSREFFSYETVCTNTECRSNSLP